MDENTIGLRDLEFDIVPVKCVSTGGTRYTRWLRAGMPKIPQRVIDSTFFLYQSEEDALAGKNPGGTGFVVSTGLSNLEVSDGPCFYAVTNWHVACRDGFSVPRFKKRDGSVDVFEFGPDEWEFIPGGQDVAVIPIYPDADRHSGPLSVSIGAFAPESAINPHATWGSSGTLSIGDDVFMLGLFVDHSHLTTNVPCARFGNISMFPDENAPIEQANHHLRSNFVVDMHSRSGFSGSPVFAFRTFGSDLTTDEHRIEDFSVEEDSMHRGIMHNFSIKSARATIRHRTMFYLLGIHWGQFREKWDVKKGVITAEAAEAMDKAHAITDGVHLEGMSGLTLVVPSWEIKEVLNLPKLKKAREAKAAAVKSSGAPIAESAQAKDDKNPEHREDFTRLLNVATKKREPKD